MERFRDVDSEKPIAFPLPPASQRAIYFPWLKVSVAFRYVLKFPWAPEREWSRLDGLRRLRRGDCAGPRAGDRPRCPDR
jgi:hypothetical protein